MTGLSGLYSRRQRAFRRYVGAAGATLALAIPASVLTSRAVPPVGYDALAFARDGSGIGGSTGTPFVFDAAKLRTNEAAFRATIARSEQKPGNVLVTLHDRARAGTGERDRAIYTDGRYEDLVSLVPGAGPGGDNVFRFTIQGPNLGGESPTPELATSAGNRHSLWIWVRRRYQPGFAGKGDGNSPAAVAYNASQGAGYKIGPYAGYGYYDSVHKTVYYGRAGLQTGNGNLRGAADYDLINLPQGSPQPAGINDTRIGAVTTEWTDGRWRDVLVYVGNTLDRDGVIRVHAAAWQRIEGSGEPYARIGHALTGVIGPASEWTRPQFAQILLSLNYNFSRATDLTYDVWGWAAFDAEKYPNPFHVDLGN